MLLQGLIIADHDSQFMIFIGFFADGYDLPAAAVKDLQSVVSFKKPDLIADSQSNLVRRSIGRRHSYDNVRPGQLTPFT